MTSGAVGELGTEGAPDDADASVNPLSAEVRQQLSVFQNRLKRTYYSRLEASKRLQSCNTAISSGMVLFNLASVLSAIRLLGDESTSYWPSSPYTSIAFAIIALVLSLYSATADYGRRAQRLFENYREIQKLWAAAEKFPDDHTRAMQLYNALKEKYDDQLDGHENHTINDYRVVLFEESLSDGNNKNSRNVAGRDIGVPQEDEQTSFGADEVRRGWIGNAWGWVHGLWVKHGKARELRLRGRLVWVIPFIAFAAVAANIVTGYL